MKRSDFIKTTAIATAGLWVNHSSFAATKNDFPQVRLPLAQRKFSSKVIEDVIVNVKKSIGNKELAWLFENCFPNTLDTTVDYELIDGKPDSYVITGDIDAMWLRDSTAQVWPYLPYIQQDETLKKMIQGVVNRQVKCVLLDPYANAFFKDENKVSEWSKDLTDMKPGIHERKWEIDSLCYPIRLSYGYWKQTGEIGIFDQDWLKATKSILKTFKEQQRKNGRGPYKFERITGWAIDTVPLGGYGYPSEPSGLISSMFRPSDDATMLPHLIPSNFFALVSLQQLQEIYKALHVSASLMSEVAALHKELKSALEKNSMVQHKKNTIYAYEVNSYGSYNLMDDANIPSLLSLPYLGALSQKDPIYQNTRKFILSQNNPFFFKGTAGEGIGGPHVGIDMIWPLSIIMRGLTSDNDMEIKQCLNTLIHANAGTGFMHEAFHKNDAQKFTRKWFAWANTLFGEFVLKVYKEKKYLLQ